MYLGLTFKVEKILYSHNACVNFCLSSVVKISIMFCGGVDFYNIASAPTGKERGKVDVCLRAEGEGREEGRKGEYKTQPKTYFTHRQKRFCIKHWTLLAWC